MLEIQFYQFRKDGEYEGKWILFVFYIDIPQVRMQKCTGIGNKIALYLPKYNCLYYAILLHKMIPEKQV